MQIWQAFFVSAELKESFMSGTIQYNTLFIISTVLRNKALVIILMDSQHYTCSTTEWLWQQHKKLDADDNWLTASIIKHRQSSGDDVNKAARLLSWAFERLYLYLSYHSDTERSSAWTWHHYSGPRWRGLLFRDHGFIQWPGGGLTYAPDLFPRAVPVKRDDGWNLSPTMTDRDTDRGPGDKHRDSSVWGRKEMTKFTMEYCCKSSFKCSRMGWSLHMAFWLLARNGHWTGNNGIMEGKKRFDTEGHCKGKLFLSCLNSELYHKRNWS